MICLESVSTWAVAVTDLFRLAMLLLLFTRDWTCFLKKNFCDAFADGLPPGSCLGRSSGRLGFVADDARTVLPVRLFLRGVVPDCCMLEVPEDFFTFGLK